MKRHTHRQHTHQLNDALLQHYGALMGSAELRHVLGFRSAASFQRAVRQKNLKIPIFDVPGRRGKFALTADVAAWLAEISASSQKPVECPSPEAAGEEETRELAETSKEAKM